MTEPEDLLADVFPGTEDAPTPRWGTTFPPGCAWPQLEPDDREALSASGSRCVRSPADGAVRAAASLSGPGNGNGGEA